MPMSQSLCIKLQPEISKNEYITDQEWENYGPGAICSLLSFLIQPAEVEVIILIVCE